MAERKPGQPTKYKEEYNEQVFKYCLLGCTDRQMADLFNVQESTFNTWKIEHPKFLESIKEGKEGADAEIAKALYHRAKGYSHKEDKVFPMGSDESGPKEPLIVETEKHYPPDTAAAFIWLKNRRSGKWRDKTSQAKFKKGATPAETADAIMQTVSEGDMSPEIGATLIASLKSLIDIDMATDMKERIEGIEETLGVNRE